jgi:MoCo/4Fe-4S cofactor protein with predicted Tat translocation signal
MSSDLNSKVPQAKDLAALRTKLAQENGKRFWQSLEELSETKEYREFLENEFPHDPEKDPQGMNRRDVLKLAHDGVNRPRPEEAAAEDEAALGRDSQTMMQVPSRLVPAIRKLIASKGR